MYSIKNIIKYLKQHFLNKSNNIISKDSKKVEKLSNISVGDIIWAKRYNNMEEKMYYRDGHDKGPFLVLKNTGRNLICSLGTSSTKNIYNRGYFIRIDGKRYDLTKDGCYSLNQTHIVNKKSFMRKVGSLCDGDKTKLFRKIKLINKDYYIKNKLIDLKLPLISGDIINSNNINYIVLDTKDDTIYCVPVDGDINNINASKIKKLDYSKLECLDLNKNYKYVSTLSNSKSLALWYSQKAYIDYFLYRKHPRIGSIFMEDNKYYYVYGEEEQEWLIFELHKQYDPNKFCMKINGNKFYTDFNIIKINKIEKVNEILFLSMNHITNIKNHLEKYKNVKYCSVGDIIENKNTKSNYIIIDIKDDLFYGIQINDNTDVTNSKFIKEIDFSNLTSLELNKYKKYKGRLDSNIIKILMESQLEYIKSKIVERGNVILKNNIKYYVYGEEGQDWLVFEIYEKCSLDQINITIDNKKFYTNFKSSMISKKQVLNTIMCATEDEINNIKECKKIYTAKLKIKEKQSKTVENDVCLLGDVIESKKYKKEKFLIVKDCGSSFGCLSLDKLNDGVLDAISLSKLNCTRSHNSNLYKIKWFELHPDFDKKDIMKKKNINSILNFQRKYTSYLTTNNLSNEQINIGDSVEKNNKKYIVTEIIDNIIGCIDSSIDESIRPTLYFYENELNVINDTNNMKNNVKIKKM